MRFINLKKIKTYVPEIAMSFLTFAVFLVVYLLKTSDPKYKEWYAVFASWASFIFFAAALTVCIFAAGREIRKLFGRPAPAPGQDGGTLPPEQEIVKVSAEDITGRPDRKTLWLDIGVIVLCSIVFALLTVFLTAVVSWAVGRTGSFADIVRFRYSTLDSQHYLYIAEHWYTPDAPGAEYGRVVEIVFMPGYPILVKLFSFVTGDFFAAGMLVSFLAFTASAVLLYLLMLEDRDRKDALYAVMLLFLMPGAFFFISPMSESLFLALILGTILLIRKKKWLAAGICGMFCAFTRSLGILVAVIFVYELLADFVEKLKEKTSAGSLNKAKAARLFGSYILKLLPVILVGVGLLAYLIINKKVNNDPFSFTVYEKKHWHQEMGWFFDTASYSARNMVLYVKNSAGGNTYTGITVFGMNLLAMLFILLTFIFKGRKTRVSYLIYAILYFCFSYGVTWLLSGIRYMDGLFFIPLALASGSGRYLFGSANGDNKKDLRLFLFGRLRSVLLIVFMSGLSAVYMVFFCLRFQIW